MLYAMNIFLPSPFIRMLSCFTYSKGCCSDAKLLFPVKNKSSVAVIVDKLQPEFPYPSPSFHREMPIYALIFLDVELEMISYVPGSLICTH